MASTIKSIPILQEQEAENFLRRAETNVDKRDSVNFKEQLNSASAILLKAGL